MANTDQRLAPQRPFRRPVSATSLAVTKPKPKIENPQVLVTHPAHAGEHLLHRRIAGPTRLARPAHELRHAGAAVLVKEKRDGAEAGERRQGILGHKIR
jgi:hypothetical protein